MTRNPPERVRGERPERLLSAFPEEAPAEAKPVDSQMLRDLWPFVRAHLGLFVLALSVMPLVAAATVYQPRLLKQAVDAVGGRRGEEVLEQVAMQYAGLIVLRFGLQFVQTYAMQLAGQRTIADLRARVFSHLQRLSMSFFDRTPVGRLVTRVTNDMDGLGELFATGVVNALGDVLLLVGVVVSMLLLDLRMSLLAFAVLPPMIAVIEVCRRQLRRAHRVIRARIAQLNALLNEQVQGVHVVAAFGQEILCQRAYARVNASHRDAHLSQIRLDAMLYSLVEAVSSICVGLLLWYAAVRIGVLDDPQAAEAYKGTFVAFYAYIQQFFVPVRDLSAKYTAIQSSLASAERVFGLLATHEWDAPEGPEPKAAPPPADETAPAVELVDVTFAYKPDQPVLKDVSLRVEPGQMVALVGATGAGKTTVTALLQRFYDATDGQVRVRGHDVRDYPREALRRLFAVVQQDVFLFTGSVLENVAYGDPEPNVERARGCLERVGAWALLEPRGGLAAPVVERGANLSLGERQLIAFARALYRDPPIVILDEATANIDSQTEVVLQRAVETVLRGRTALVVAHRLSTIRRADQIFVFHHGRLSEHGNHDSLLARGGIYARLVRLHQLGGAGARPVPALQRGAPGE